MEREIGNEGALNGTTPVEILGAPASGLRRTVPASGISVYNRDTVAHTFTFTKEKGASSFPFWCEATVAAGVHVVLPKKIVLDATDESLEVVSDAAATTTEPTFDVAAMECD